MKKIIILTTGTFIIVALNIIAVSAKEFKQTSDSKQTGNAWIVHNVQKGKWGDSPRIELSFNRNIGSFDAIDDNQVFYLPADIVRDRKGNIYILDSGNHRIQKFSPSGKYLETFGEEGQGPAEYKMPISMDIDSEDKLYISDIGNLRSQIIDQSGRHYKTISFEKPPGVFRVSSNSEMRMGGSGMLGGPMMMTMERQESPDQIKPQLIKYLDTNGELKKYYAEPSEYNDFMLNRRGNFFHFILDKDDNTYISFDFQNRIEKYSPDGKLLLKIDRKLNYSTVSPKPDKDNLKVSGGNRNRSIAMRMPEMNSVSSGIAVDEEGRIWVVTFSRQLKKNEQINENVNVNNSNGERSLMYTISGNTDNRKTDMFKLEIFDTNGELLGHIPVDHFVDDIRIFGDKVYLLDKFRGMQYYEYEIIEK